MNRFIKFIFLIISLLNAQSIKLTCMDREVIPRTPLQDDQLENDQYDQYDIVIPETPLPEQIEPQTSLSGITKCLKLLLTKMQQAKLFYQELAKLNPNMTLLEEIFKNNNFNLDYNNLELITKTNSVGMTLLHKACQAKNLKLLQQLLNHPLYYFSINQKDVINFTPLDYAIDENFIDGIKILLINKYINNPRIHTPHYLVREKYNSITANLS